MHNLRQKIAITLIALIATTSSMFAQDTKKDVDYHEHYITVSVVEVYKDKLVSEIIICYGKDHTRTVPLKKYHKDNRINNLEKLTEVLNELGAEGYEVISSSIAVTNHHQKKFFILEKMD